MSSQNEFESLQNRKEGLEKELQSETEREKTLQEDVKIFEVKVAIKKLEEQLKAKHEAAEKLESKTKDLKTELEKPESAKTTEEQKPEAIEKVDEQEEKDLQVAVIPAENSQPAESQETEKEKQKKYRFF